MDLKLEKKYFKKGFKAIVGLDEAGRGPLAGPVVASAVLLTPQILNIDKSLKKDFFLLLKEVKDSKKLSFKKRQKIFNLLKKIKEIKYSFALINNKTIDKINIERATFLAMEKCLQKLEKKYKIKPDLLLIDGNRCLLKKDTLIKTIVKGDNKVFVIALSSIISKVVRDNKMINLAKKFPQYKFEIHKGYPTKLHLKLIKKYGPCEIHRKSFKPSNLKIKN